jgi:hypothetical protein
MDDPYTGGSEDKTNAFDNSIAPAAPLSSAEPAQVDGATVTPPPVEVSTGEAPVFPEIAVSPAVEQPAAEKINLDDLRQALRTLQEQEKSAQQVNDANRLAEIRRQIIETQTKINSTTTGSDLSQSATPPPAAPPANQGWQQ